MPRLSVGALGPGASAGGEMEQGFRLEQKLGMKLAMTPRLQQAIKLLQYNHMEMLAHVQEAMLENPTLEAVPDSEGPGPEAERDLRERTAAAEQAEKADSHNGEGEGVDWERFLEQMREGSGLRGVTGGTIHDDLPPIETNLTYGESLADHLGFQLTMTRLNDEEYRVANAIVQNLDERGYLDVALETIAEQLGVSAEIAEDALEIVQQLDPVGCGARSLSECLIVQAKHHFPEDDAFPRILVEHHLHNLERRNYQAIARDLGIELEDVIEYHKMIQELEPLPGRGFSSEEPRYITPDLYVVKSGDDWHVLLNEEGLPELRVSRYYQKILKGASKTDRDYLLDKLRGAEFLIRSINKRRKTIRRVMESILKFQRDFFESGASALRPLVLQDVADDVEVHMSTVSRVTTNKYVHTPHGIFELKYFFSTGVRQGTGEDMAAEAIKDRIGKLVGEEDRKKPLSDQQIADRLKKEGVHCARRTVAKYREALGILPSSQRKRVF